MNATNKLSAALLAAILVSTSVPSHALRTTESAETGLEEQLRQALNSNSPDELVHAAGRFASTALGLASVVVRPEPSRRAGLEEDEIQRSLIGLARRKFPQFLPYSRVDPQHGLYREWLAQMLDRSPWVWISSGFINPDSPSGGTLDVYSHVPKFKVTEFEVLKAGWIKLEIPLNPEQEPVLQWLGSSSVFQPPGLRVPARRIFPALDLWNSLWFSEGFLMYLLEQNRKARSEVSNSGEFSSEETAQRAARLQQEWLDREPQPITEADFPLPIGSLLVPSGLFFEGSLLLTDIWLVTGMEPSSLPRGSPFVIIQRLDQPRWLINDLTGERRAYALSRVNGPLSENQEAPKESKLYRVPLQESALREFFYIPSDASVLTEKERTEPVRSDRLPSSGKIVIPDTNLPGIRGIVSASRSDGVDLKPVDRNGKPIPGTKPQFFSMEQLLRGQAGVLLPPLNDPASETVLVSSGDTHQMMRSSAGLEEVQVKRVEDLMEMGDASADELALELMEAGKPGVALFPKEAADRQPIFHADRQIVVYAHEEVAAGLLALLPASWNSKGRISHLFPYLEQSRSQLADAMSFSKSNEWDGMVVIGLDVQQGIRAEDVAHIDAVKMLFDPGTMSKLDFKVHFFLSRLDLLKNVVLDLTSGSVRVVTIQGTEYYALDIAA